MVVGFQIGDLAQQDDGRVAGGQVLGFPCGCVCVLFDLMALGGIKRHGWPHGSAVSDLAQQAGGMVQGANIANS